MSIRVIISDDDYQTRIILHKYLEMLPEFIIIGEASSGAELVRLIKERKPDLVLADIQMPDLNGLTAIRECLALLPDLNVIFVTGYDHFATQAFEIAAVDYIMKPVHRPRLYEALEKAKHRVTMERHLAALHAQARRKFPIRLHKSVHYIGYDDILFIEKDGKKIIFHTLQHQSVESLDKLDELLGPFELPLIQSHRSYIVNLNHISRISKMGETYLAYFGKYPHFAHIAKGRLKQIQSLLQCEGVHAP